MNKLKMSLNRKPRPAIAAIAAMIMGSSAIIIAISNLIQGPTAAEPPNAAEWLSAISTFWGAVAGGIGAIGTAGALLVAAFGYQHQIEARNREAEDRRQQAKEKRRAQALAIRLSVSPQTFAGGVEMFACDLKNFSNLPVSTLKVVAVDAAGAEIKRHEVGLLVPEQPIRKIVPLSALPGPSYASFRDAEGLAWKLYFDDRLEEQVPAEVVAT